MKVAAGSPVATKNVKPGKCRLSPTQIGPARVRAGP